MSNTRKLHIDEVTSIERVSNGWVCHWQTTARKGATFVTLEQLQILADTRIVLVEDL